ncbi:MAG: TIR domain-containing protein [Spirulinaceae cyanobacterium RM2_2_10]|nr:TIR domain-containing protein [Spirulinaceae cyanobacterium SM2_1_0]NJO20270.1 TIR domain-containing protein [Spirulinaceae cyanobacterium RM2_2_10]
MAKRVFFSFHYQDALDFRASVVRNHWLNNPESQAAGFFEAPAWTATEPQDLARAKQLSDQALAGTSSTCVLIGTQTYQQPQVRYEIMRSIKNGNPVSGIHINSLKGRNGNTKSRGKNPFKYLGIEFSGSGYRAMLWELIDDRWQRYNELDRSFSYICQRVKPEQRGKFLELAALVPVRDWMVNAGYKNLAKWL